jgi:hypothetical protein
MVALLQILKGNIRKVSRLQNLHINEEESRNDVDVLRFCRQEAERLRRDRDLALFTFGNHLQLVLYLSKIYPLSDSAKV